MNEVFRVELFGEKTDRWCELELPASYYGLQDALDKIQMPLGDKPRWEFLEHHSFQFLHVHLTMNVICISSMRWQPAWDR